MYTDGPYSAKFQRMYEDCPHCGLHYEVETGFFWGAMYINYAFTVATFISSFVAMQVLAPEAPTYYTIVLMLALLLVLLPVYVRFSRILMLYLFGGVKFDPELHKAKADEAKALPSASPARTQ